MRFAMLLAHSPDCPFSPVSPFVCIGAGPLKTRLRWFLPLRLLPILLLGLPRERTSPFFDHETLQVASRQRNNATGLDPVGRRLSTQCVPLFPGPPSRRMPEHGSTSCPWIELGGQA